MSSCYIFSLGQLQYDCIICIFFCRLGLVTKLHVMNPKACSVIELYGVLDPVTRDWTDGLLSNIFREINRPTDKNERKYILFDGDVDALWVENMNSVMDDNKLLTLANGERIRLQKHCALLVEVIFHIYSMFVNRLELNILLLFPIILFLNSHKFSQLFSKLFSSNL